MFLRIRMPPLEPSLRASLLTGASAIALSMPGGAAHAQAPRSPTLSSTPPENLQLWIEGAAFFGAGGSFAVPFLLPGLGGPYSSFNPQNGFEFAFGADYRPQGTPYHYVFDFRFGKTGTATSNTSGTTSSSSSTFVTASTGFFGTLFGTQTNINSNTAASQATKKWENHLVADLMIGRDIGIGSNRPELLFGIRVADLHASAQALLNAQTNTTTTVIRTFQSEFFTSSSNTSTTSTTQSILARWNSRFFGAGPRVNLTGSVPIGGAWAFEYSGGAALLIGDRSLGVSIFNNGVGTSALYNETAAILNADAIAALSYSFTPHYKVTAGLRADYYNAALKTYDVNTGGFTNVDRLFWGPFLRLTGSF
jgi:hypothetical protein